jgi:hypothetical protein
VHVFVKATTEKAAAPEQSDALKTSSVAARAVGANERASASANATVSDGGAAKNRGWKRELGSVIFQESWKLGSAGAACLVKSADCDPKRSLAAATRRVAA